MSDTVPIQDKQSVTPEGQSVKPLIQGLIVRPARTIEDKRGEVVEIYRPAWNVHPDPLVYVNQVSIRPGAIKGWTVHHQQDDRIYLCLGVTRWAFYDARDDSPTYKMVNEFVFSDRTRALLIIPHGVFHAVKNIGQTEAIFIDMPTQPYDHENPDKYRLPPHNAVIPFDFDDGPGW